MSGIVGSYFNTRGSGVVAKLGTDGQVFTSTGAGLSQGFEAAAGGGKILQVQTVINTGVESVAADSTWNTWTDTTVTITPTAASSKMFILGQLNMSQCNDASIRIGRTIDGGSTEGVLIGDERGSRQRATSGGNQFRTPYETMQSVAIGVDVPSYTLTDVLTYFWQGWDNGGTLYINREGIDNDAENDNTSITSLTVMEIGA